MVSVLALRKRHHRRYRKHRRQGFLADKELGRFGQILALTDVPPGWRARVISISPELTPSQLAYLQSYGVLDGYWVQVVQQSPVSVIQVEHIELALEKEISAQICVTDLTRMS
jgi:Fe2+ transport system protein FeoA